MPDELATTMPPPSDILNISGPALSATSDMPVVVPATTETANAVALEHSADETAGTEVEAGAESAAQAQEGGEEASGEVAQQPRSDPRTARIRAAEDRAEKALAAVERLTAAMEADRAARAAPQQPQTPAEVPRQAPDAPRPQRQNFDDPEVYDEALIEWSTARAATAAAQRFEASRAEREQQAAQTEAQTRAAEAHAERLAGWNEQKTKFAEAHPDYADVAESDALQISQPMAQAIWESDNGPAVAYYLGQHPEEAAKLAAATVFNNDPTHNARSVIRAAAAIGAISAKLAAPVAAAPRPRPLPAPISPIGNNASAGGPDLDTMTGDDYADMRLPQLQAQRRPGGVGRTMN